MQSPNYIDNFNAQMQNHSLHNIVHTVHTPGQLQYKAIHNTEKNKVNKIFIYGCNLDVPLLKEYNALLTTQNNQLFQPSLKINIYVDKGTHLASYQTLQNSLPI